MIKAWCCLSLILWFLHFEFDSGLRGMWIRPDASGQPRFTPLNVARLFILPFQASHTWLWNIDMIDINPYLFLLMSLTIYSLIHVFDRVIMTTLYDLYCVKEYKIRTTYKSSKLNFIVGLVREIRNLMK